MIGSEIEKLSSDPGVPEALPRMLIRLRDRMGIEALDRVWIFPPVRKGRCEQGLIAVSTFQDGEDRRGMTTVAYHAERTGKGVTVEPYFTREGEALADRFPGVMRGVVRRGGEEKGEPREVEIDGSAERFEELMDEFDGDFLGVSDP